MKVKCKKKTMTWKQQLHFGDCESDIKHTEKGHFQLLLAHLCSARTFFFLGFEYTPCLINLI